MKKSVLTILAIVLVLGLMGKIYAQSGLSANASPQTVRVNAATRYVGITFPYPTRNLSIINGDANEGVWIDLNDADNTGQRNQCVLLDAGQSLDLYDFITNAITIVWDNIYTSGEASPIAVLATY